MAPFKSIASLKQADSITWDGLEIAPVAQTFQLKWPLGSSGFIYNRPHSILVRTEGQPVRKLPIQDQTRRLQLFIAVYTLCSIVLIWLLSGQRA